MFKFGLRGRLLNHPSGRLMSECCCIERVGYTLPYHYNLSGSGIPESDWFDAYVYSPLHIEFVGFRYCDIDEGTGSGWLHKGRGSAGPLLNWQFRSAELRRIHTRNVKDKQYTLKARIMNFGYAAAAFGFVNSDTYIENNSGDFISIRVKDEGSFTDEVNVTVKETEIDYGAYKEYLYEIKEDIEINSSVYTIAQYENRTYAMAFYLLPVDGVTYPPYIDQMPNPSYYFSSSGVAGTPTLCPEEVDSSSSVDSEDTLLEDRLRHASGLSTVNGSGYIADVDKKYETGSDDYHYEKTWIPHNVTDIEVEINGTADEITLDGTPIAEATPIPVTGPGFLEIKVKNPSLGSGVTVDVTVDSSVEPSWMLTYTPPGTAEEFRAGRTHTHDSNQLDGTEDDWASADDYFYWKESTVFAEYY